MISVPVFHMINFTLSAIISYGWNCLDNDDDDDDDVDDYDDDDDSHFFDDDLVFDLNNSSMNFCFVGVLCGDDGFLFSI